MTSPSPLPKCPECGAGYRLGGGRCWLCGAWLPAKRAQAELLRPAPASQHDDIVDAMLVTRETAATFSLSSMFLVVTLAAVAAGVFAAAPGLGILFLVVATPALVRTVVVGSRTKRLGVATTPRAKILDFLQSAGVAVLILFCVVGALGIAAFMACTGAVAGGLLSDSINKGPDAGMMAGAAAGGLVALAGIGAVLWAVWNSARTRR